VRRRGILPDRAILEKPRIGMKVRPARALVRIHRIDPSSRFS
jgi:hypothetical protein